jgi:hypothetical protein
MKRLILLVGFLFVISILPLLAEQSNISEPNYPAIEIRLLALEERLDALEQRVTQLEKPQPPIPTSSTDPDKNTLRIDRCTKIIQEARDAIELIKTQIENLPFENENLPFENLTGEHRLRAIEKEWRSISDQELQDRLKAAQRKFRLLADEELSHLKIVQLAEKYPDLGVDVMEAKKDLIECQGDKKKTDLEMWYLRRIIENRKKKTDSGDDYHHENVVPKGY